MSLEPAFLDKLPPRFRKRWRENLITLGVVVALFVIPPRCGPYGVVSFFTIIWLAYAVFYVSKLRSSVVPVSAGAYVMLLMLLSASAYPLIVGWASLTFTAAGLVCLGIGAIVNLVFLIAYRKIVLSSMFGADRRPIAEDFRAVRAAQRAARAESAERIDRIFNDRLKNAGRSRLKVTALRHCRRRSRCLAPQTSMAARRGQMHQRSKTSALSGTEQHIRRLPLAAGCSGIGS